MTEKQAKLAVGLLRCWVAGCGDPRYASKAEVENLIKASGDFLRELDSPSGQPSPPNRF